MARILSALVAGLSKDGIIPAVATLSLLSNEKDYTMIRNNPLTATWGALVVGGIGGGMVERLTTTHSRPFIAGGLLVLALGTVAHRSYHHWYPTGSITGPFSPRS